MPADLRDTFITYMFEDLSLFFKKKIFKQVMMNEIVDSSTKALKMEMI